MMLRKPKRKPLAKVKKDVWDVFSKYIRMRDCFKATGSVEYGECITCGEPLSFAKLQAGHFIPKHNANYFSERGVHTQCVSCNMYHGGRPLEYRRQIIKLYGEGADLELEEEAKQIRKFTIPELEGMMTDYKNRIEQLKGGNKWRENE